MGLPGAWVLVQAVLDVGRAVEEARSLQVVDLGAGGGWWPRGRALLLLEPDRPLDPRAPLLLLAGRAAPLPPRLASYTGHTYILLGPASPLILAPEDLLFRPNVVTMASTNSSTLLYFNKSKRTFEPLTEKLDFKKKIEDEEMEELRRDAVRVRSFNCTIYSNFGPIQTNGKPVWYDGVEMRVFEEMAHRLNLTWRVEPSAGFGRKLANGSWIPGINKDLAHKEGHIGFCGLWAEPSTQYGTEMVDTTYKSCQRFIVPKPRIRPLPWFVFAQMYQPAVWMTVSLVTLLSASATVLAEYLTPGKTKGWGLTLYSVATRLTLVNYNPPSRVVGAFRPLEFSWALLALILATGYSCNLVAILTTPTLSPKLDTVEQIIARGCPWSINGHEEDDITNIFKDEQELMRALEGSMVSSGEEDHWERYPCFALLGQSVERTFFLVRLEDSSVFSDFEASSQCLVGHIYSIMVRGDTPLVEPLRRLANRMREMGIVNKYFSQVRSSPRLRQFVLPNAFLPIKLTAHPLTRLSLAKLSTAFFILLLGLSISLVAFLLEIAWFKIANRLIPLPRTPSRYSGTLFL